MDIISLTLSSSIRPIDPGNKNFLDYLAEISCHDKTFTSPFCYFLIDFYNSILNGFLESHKNSTLPDQVAFASRHALSFGASLESARTREYVECHLTSFFAYNQILFYLSEKAGSDAVSRLIRQIVQQSDDENGDDPAFPVQT